MNWLLLMEVRFSADTECTTSLSIFCCYLFIVKPSNFNLAVIGLWANVAQKIKMFGW